MKIIIRTILIPAIAICRNFHESFGENNTVSNRSCDTKLKKTKIGSSESRNRRTKECDFSNTKNHLNSIHPHRGYKYTKLGEFLRCARPPNFHHIFIITPMKIGACQRRKLKNLVVRRRNTINRDSIRIILAS